MTTKIKDGIYEKSSGVWVVYENGKPTQFKAPDYDLAYLLRAYKERLHYRGSLDSSGKRTEPTNAELTAHLPEDIKRAFSPKELEDIVLGKTRKEYEPDFNKINGILERTAKFLAELREQGRLPPK